MNITEKFLTVNKFSRPGIKLEKVTKIAVHYVGNPNTTAMANRNYFENQKTGGRYVSSHFIVGLDGEIIQCIPLNEWSYCTNQANGYSISIECCHPKSDGIFNDKTYVSLCELCAYLLKKFGLSTDDLIRHFDVTGKQCPLDWSPTKYQSNALAKAKWDRFKADVKIVMNGGTVYKNNTVGVTEKTSSDNTAPSPAVPYKVKVIDTSLNVRKGAGVNNPVTCVIRKNEVYTIVEEAKVRNSDGSVATWGLLKAYAKNRNGWINVGEKYVKKVL